MHSVAHVTVGQFSLPIRKRQNSISDVISSCGRVMENVNWDLFLTVRYICLIIEVTEPIHFPITILHDIYMTAWV